MSSEHKNAAGWRGIIQGYREHLAVGLETPIISLHEGNTPLIRVPNFVEAIGGAFDLYLKYEGLNPTSSFKDRGMSAAAYAARAKMKCVVLIPESKIARGKLAQALMYGATTLQMPGNFDDALTIVRELCADGVVESVNSINPHRIEGQKTAAFEICDALGDAPDMHVLPVGNAGNISAYWKGYREYADAGKSDTLPRMMGFQAAGAAPFVEDVFIDHPETIASAIRIGKPANWQPAKAALQFSAGAIDKVTDEEILTAYQMISAQEGIFVEPASAAALAGIIKLQSANKIAEGSIVVATMTGHGLKDPDTAVEHAKVKATTVEPNLDAVKAAIGL